MKLSHGNANCLFALLSRATEVAKSKSACPDFIYRHDDICAIYIFEGVEIFDCVKCKQKFAAKLQTICRQKQQN